MGLPTGWAAPKINWATDDAPTATHFNAFEGNTKAIETGARTIDQSVTPADNTATLSQLVDEIPHQLNAIIGKTNWYDAPDKTVKELSERFTLSGVAFPHATVTYDIQKYFDTPDMLMVQKFAVNIPANTSLIVSRARYHFNENTYRIIVFGDASVIPGYPIINLLSHFGWLGANNYLGTFSENDESPVTDNIVAWNGTGAPVLRRVHIGIWCPGDDKTLVHSGDGWTVDFGFEAGVPTTTTTAGA